jgi:hypothetical protein
MAAGGALHYTESRMIWRGERLEGRLLSIDGELAALRLPPGEPVAAAISRWRADAAAMLFHLRDAGDTRRVAVILGGTGTGKSTLVNRLVAANVSAASFLRTHTAGAVAIGPGPDGGLPAGWLGLPHEPAGAQDLPARGVPDRVVIVTIDHELTLQATLVDTPDLDGDQPQHHAQADRAFRWAQAVVFLVTPEKYQMTELLPYYRLAGRYAIASLFVMNKVDEAGAVQDYARRLVETGAQASGAAAGNGVFAVPRDDAAYEPSPDAGLEALRRAIGSMSQPSSRERAQGLGHRQTDLLNRLQDQVIAPLADARRQADRMIAALRAMETPPVGVDVNPITRQLQRRLQQRSILYLIGPQRILDRVRQAPGLLARLPRTTWDLLRHGRAKVDDPTPVLETDRSVPDFAAALQDQFTLVQSRIEDVLRSSSAGQQWLDHDPAGWTQARCNPARAGEIAVDALAELKGWLEEKWNATPRDTRLLMKLLRHLPGGEQLTRWSEAAPYLLAIVVATHGAFFGHLDLMILGGYSLATWLSERLSDEVASRTRRTNRRIAESFEQLAHEQISAAIAWVAARVPDAATIARLQRLADEAMQAPLS